MRRTFILIFLSPLPLIGFCQDLLPFTWLTGTWEMPRPKGGFRLETWVQKDDQTFSGKGLKVVETDTTLLEWIEIKVDQGDVWYVPTVPDQNNAKAIPFKLVSFVDHHYVFENPQHDFPQRITYAFKPVKEANSLIATPGDTIDMDVTSLEGDGIHYRFTRKK